MSNQLWLDDAALIFREADRRRKKAEYDTGSITEREAYILRSLVEHIGASVIVEVGTFIGTSTMSLAAASKVTAVYTCDVSNDCTKGSEIIRTFPKQRSTKMLQWLVERDIQPDLCFFDGVLRQEDVDLLHQIGTPETWFVVHDYNHGPKIRKGGRLETVPRKGIGNVNLLKPFWPGHLVVTIPDTTLAVMVPEAWQ